MKKSQLKLTACIGRSFMLTATVLIFSSATFAQANYWSVFSNAGCSTSTYSNSMSATVSPPTSASFAGIPSLSDLYHPLGGAIAENSVYSNTGQLLFSVDAYGIYDATGTQDWIFSSDATVGSGYNNGITTATVYTLPSYPATIVTYPVSAGNAILVSPGNAISEISAFPCTLSVTNSSYYVVFWADCGSAPFVEEYYALRVIQVNVGPSGSLTFPIDQILYDNQSSAGIVEVATSYIGSLGVAADAAVCGGARNLYTIEPTVNSSGPYPGSFNASNLRKWVFPADGSLPFPTTAAPSFYDQQVVPAFSPKCKILTVNTKKYFSFISGDNYGISRNAHVFAMWNITTGYTPIPGSATTSGLQNVATYDIDYNPTNYYIDIFGFEHVIAGSKI